MTVAVSMEQAEAGSAPHHFGQLVESLLQLAARTRVLERVGDIVERRTWAEFIEDRFDGVHHVVERATGAAGPVHPLPVDQARIEPHPQEPCVAGETCVLTVGVDDHDAQVTVVGE